MRFPEFLKNFKHLLTKLENRTPWPNGVRLGLENATAFSSILGNLRVQAKVIEDRGCMTAELKASVDREVAKLESMIYDDVQLCFQAAEADLPSNVN